MPIKLSPPRLTGIYLRRRLFKELERLRRSAVSWIAAPAGSGKTTLVASYLQARRLRCLWYQIDAGDADLAGFFHHMALAVQRAAPRKRHPLPHLTAEYLGDVETFARNFFREAAVRLPASTVLVFDNVQDAGTDTRFHEVLRAGIAELPEHVHVMCISRTEPPEAFARMRANRQLVCLDSKELRLREQESRELARSLTRRACGSSSAQIARLHRQCEGWMAGMIVLASRTSVSNTGTINTRGGDGLASSSRRGASGGGGGGFVALIAPSAVSSGTVNVDGDAAGDTSTPVNGSLWRTAGVAAVPVPAREETAVTSPARRP